MLVTSKSSNTSQSPHAVCPGGEGAALKAVGLKELAGSNPVDGATRRKTINPLEKITANPPNVKI